MRNIPITLTEYINILFKPKLIIKLQKKTCFPPQNGAKSIILLKNIQNRKQYYLRFFENEIHVMRNFEPQTQLESFGHFVISLYRATWE